MNNFDKKTWDTAPELFIFRFEQLCRLMPKGAPHLLPPDYNELAEVFDGITFRDFHAATGIILSVEDEFPSIASILERCISVRRHLNLEEEVTPKPKAKLVKKIKLVAITPEEK